MTGSSPLAEAQFAITPGALQGQQGADNLAMTKDSQSSLVLLILAFSKNANSRLPVVSCQESRQQFLRQNVASHSRDHCCGRIPTHPPTMIYRAVLGNLIYPKQAAVVHSSVDETWKSESSYKLGHLQHFTVHCGEQWWCHTISG